MVHLTPLSDWMIKQPGKVVAVRSGESILVPDFVTRVQVWIDTLCDQPGKRWAVYHSDSAEFLAILLALWQLGRTACIPSDNRPGTVTRMANSIDGFIGDFPSAPGAIDNPVSGNSRPGKWIIPEHNLVALEIYTSGSTGDPKSISKTIAQLECEIEVLESLWPSYPDSVVLATVSHQHLYGMTFALFWPFSSLRAFESKLCEFPEDIVYKAGLYSHFSLISSPSHLGRFNSSLDWSGIASRCKFVISSAAPLLREDSITVGLLLNTQVREIYGSSETGAIAWRSQQDSKTDSPWKALPQVELESSEGVGLTVRSPYLGELDHFVLPDKVQFDHQGCFKLIGRMDRIVKVEGKRVSLALIEGLLRDHEWVKEVSALTIERARIETAIVMRLNEEGVIHLENSGRKALIKIFKNLLSDHLESVVLPRRWRFVERMPFNPQGKLPLDCLQALFKKEDLKWPRIIDRQLVDGLLTIQCDIPPQLIYFEGHMPDRPILPGIVQIHWAEAYGRRWLAVTGRFDRLEVIKFQQVILPEYKVKISLEFNNATRKLSFRYESERGVHSSGRICFT
jgi:acyl-CoA synthetase (AMP-forming)/AMP-acid ligase II/3-hydroxymyristoyl/3-hydroxydecanoyl-(acyl carrier protein) dehydratase